MRFILILFAVLALAGSGLADTTEKNFSSITVDVYKSPG